MQDKHGPPADRHFDPHWQPALNQSDEPHDAGELTRKTDPDGTDEYQCLSGLDDD